MKQLLQKVGKKLKAIRLEKGLNVDQIHEKGISLIGKNCISPATIYRIEAGEIAKFSSLEQYLFILDMSIKDIMLNTEFEELLVLNKDERLSGFTYSENAYSTIINNPNHSFLSQEVILKPSGKTDLDYASKDQGTSQKFIYVVQGELTCVVEDNEYVIKHRGTVSFDSTKPHYFVNHGNCECIFIMVENPGRY
ncbi:MAG: helix-turn-helix transcriptional regulator [Candidatus Omnitrophica bacterium]|nr:helix-turn-helix transcriptional regulator [Candidatus Omnitrophota bacterium]